MRLTDSLGKKIGLGYFIITMVLIAVVVFTIYQVGNISKANKFNKDIRIPTAEASLQALNGVNHTLAALRGWILLGKNEFIKERESAWNNDIIPSMERLEEYSKDWTDLKNVQRLKEIHDKIHIFKKHQENIEDIAQKLDNTPALKLLLEEVSPPARIITKNIARMIEIEKARAKNTDITEHSKLIAMSRVSLLGDMADFSGSIGLCLAEIRAYLISGNIEFKMKFQQNWTTSVIALEALNEKKELLNEAQYKAFRKLSAAYELFAPLPNRMFEIRSSKEWNFANHWLATKAAPMAFEIKRLLKDMNNSHQKLRDDDFEYTLSQISLLNRTEWILFFVGITFSLVFGIYVTRSITEPIRRALDVANKVADGDLDVDVNIEGSKEIVQLGIALQRMVSQIKERMDERTKALAISEEKSRAIVDNSIDAIITISPKGTVQSINPSGERMFGYNAIEVIGNNIKMLMPSKYSTEHDGYLKHYDDTGEKRVIGGAREVEAMRKDGSVFPIRLGVTEVELESGNLFVGVIIDITKEQQSVKALNEKTKEALDANKAKSTFLATMSHEIRTPLNGIIGVTGFLSRAGFKDKNKDYIETIESSSKHLLALVNDILDFSKIEANEIHLEEHPTSINNIIQDVKNILSGEIRKNNVRFDVSCPADLPIIDADVVRIRQVLMNLTSNAVKFSKDSEVYVAAGIIRENRKDVTFRIEVIDTGIGIAEDRTNSIFNPFTQSDSSTTREYGGTGLGLAICKSIIELMGGEIGLTSEIGKGSKFWFEITAKRSNKKIVTEFNKYSKKQCLSIISGKNILVTEDNKTNRMVVCTMLEDLKANVDEAENGKIALDIIKNNHDKYDIVLMDCMMPELDGLETTKAIREFEKENNLEKITIIALTASAMSGDMEKCINIGMNDYASKPINEVSLRNILAKWLNK